MSVSDLRKYLKNKCECVPDKFQNRKLLVISDSKGGYLDRLPKQTFVQRSIRFLYRGGRTSEQTADFIESNLNSFLNIHGRILIAIFAGTCDFTMKRGNCVQLSETKVDDIIAQYKIIFSICEPYGDRVKVVILETPYYSIKIYNRHIGTKGRSISDSIDTRKLKSKIDLLNEQVHALNQLNNVRVPKFTKDLIRTRKSKKRKFETVSYSLLKDGLHPKPLLSRYWQRRLINTILADYCY